MPAIALYMMPYTSEASIELRYDIAMLLALRTTFRELRDLGRFKLIRHLSGYY